MKFSFNHDVSLFHSRTFYRVISTIFRDRFSRGIRPTRCNLEALRLDINGHRFSGDRVGSRIPRLNPIVSRLPVHPSSRPNYIAAILLRCFDDTNRARMRVRILSRILPSPFPSPLSRRTSFSEEAGETKERTFSTFPRKQGNGGRPMKPRPPSRDQSSSFHHWNVTANRCGEREPRECNGREREETEREEEARVPPFGG